jgi:hypothetical protein
VACNLWLMLPHTSMCRIFNVRSPPWEDDIAVFQCPYLKLDRMCIPQKHLCSTSHPQIHLFQDTSKTLEFACYNFSSYSYSKFIHPNSDLGKAILAKTQIFNCALKKTRRSQSSINTNANSFQWFPTTPLRIYIRYHHTPRDSKCYIPGKTIGTRLASTQPNVRNTS